jgi:hypothetical protein
MPVGSLPRRYHWWLNALGERQMRVGENSIEPLSSASVFSPCRDYTLEMKGEAWITA